MSIALDTAELIKTRLLTAPAGGELPTTVDLTPLTVLVDRQKSLLSEINKAIGKAKGTAILIVYTGFDVLDPDASTPRLANRYSLQVWSKPIIAGDDLAADDVLESVVHRMWHWIPNGAHHFDEARVLPGGMMPSKTHLVYDCEVLVPVSH
jgi:hypothetical protein